jgi:hypothetical protein
MKIFVNSSRLLAGSVLLFPLAFNVAAADLNELVNTVQTNNKKLSASQQKVNALSDQARKLYDEYKLVVQEKESLQSYNQHVETLVKSQKNELASLQVQLDEIDITSREIIPLLSRMMDSLDKFVQLDIPFLSEERNKRITDLRHMMTRADVTVAEKYRRIMEAYLVELEYGRTIEAYESELEENAKTRSVNFLRVGRIFLAYQTPDKSEMGVWNIVTRQWDALDSDYQASISKGLRIANRQAAPDLLRLPLSSPERVQ